MKLQPLRAYKEQEAYGVTFTQFLFDNEHTSLILIGPVGMYAEIK